MDGSSLIYCSFESEPNILLLVNVELFEFTFKTYINNMPVWNQNEIHKEINSKMILN